MRKQIILIILLSLICAPLSFGHDKDIPIYYSPPIQVDDPDTEGDDEPLVNDNQTTKQNHNEKQF